MYAEVVVNLPVEGTFHYHIPAELSGYLHVGHLVEVSFGRRKAQGIVLGFDQHAPVEETKPVERLIDHRPVLTEWQLQLARWLSATYLAPLADCARLFIPPGLSKRGDVLITPLVDLETVEPSGDTQARLLRLLTRRGPLRGRQIARSLPRRDWQGAVRDLVERELAIREPVLDPPSVSAKQVRLAALAIAPDAVDAAINRHLNPEELPSTRQGAALRRAEVLRYLAAERQAVEVGDVYAAVEGSTLTDLRRLAEDDLVALRQAEIWRDPLAGRTFMPDDPPHLTAHQAEAWVAIRRALADDVAEPPRPILLHGVTGSGKTELYLRAVDEVISQGRSAIVMVPEIALTPQTVQRFGARFPGRMGLIHSGLSTGERYDTWRRARDGQFDVVIGPRSALFAPLDNLGLIVIDECHDDSYKQTPPIAPPYYHAVPTAVELARLNGALTLLGSATPNVTTYANAVPFGLPGPGEYTLLELPARIMGHREAIEAQAIHYHIPTTRYAHQADDPDQAVMIELPPVQVVDMRQELRAHNRSIFSRALADALEEVLPRGEQAILFLNRRGTSTYVFCRACGHVMLCPHCEVPLTWHTYGGKSRSDMLSRTPEGVLHGSQGKLVCHHCNYRADHPQTCPACGSDQIKFFGGGTERVETELASRFPEAVPLRWDRDTTSGRDSHDELLRRFVDGEANVLIGTQMVAKGLDLPLVTLVGVISADTALNLPDYRSGERTFQLLTQVAGRAGRGLLGGRVILQTYAPDNYAIAAAAEHDYHAFYDQELQKRAEIGYPPFSKLVRLEVRATDSERAREVAQKLHARLKHRIREEKRVETHLIGPAPCFYPRIDDMYRWHVIVRGPDPAALVGDLRTSERLIIDVDPVSLL
jgi:primosomal protein N' (replication factor Y)